MGFRISEVGSDRSEYSDLGVVQNYLSLSANEMWVLWDITTMVSQILTNFDFVQIGHGLKLVCLSIMNPKFIWIKSSKVYGWNKSATTGSETWDSQWNSIWCHTSWFSASAWQDWWTLVGQGIKSACIGDWIQSMSVMLSHFCKSGLLDTTQMK